MEYIILIITHILKSAEFFITEGMPRVPFDKLPEAAEALLFNLIKLVEIYTSIL